MSMSPRHHSTTVQRDREVDTKLANVLQTITAIKSQKERDAKQNYLQKNVEKYEKILPMIDDPLRNGAGTHRTYQSPIVDKDASRAAYPNFNASAAGGGFGASSSSAVAPLSPRNGGGGATKFSPRSTGGPNSGRIKKPTEATSLQLGSTYFYAPHVPSASGSLSGSAAQSPTANNNGGGGTHYGKAGHGRSVPTPPTSYYNNNKQQQQQQFDGSLSGTNNNFRMGSPKNGFISKTTFSSAFDHWNEATEKEMAETGCGPSSSAKNRKSPRLQLQAKHFDERLHAPRSEIREHQRPYKTLIESSTSEKRGKDLAMESLRNRVVDQLRQVRSVEEIEAKTDPKRDYEYAQGVKVSLTLESDNKAEKRIGIRVYENADPSPVSGLQYQTARSAKEGLITRRKHVPVQDNLTMQFAKKKNQTEDASIFAEKNSYLRAGLASIETKGSSPRGVHD